VDAALARLLEQRVVDVGDVAHALDRVAEVEQAALEHVVEHERRRVPEVRGVVRGDPARVHQHVGVRLERHHRLAGGVVQPHHALGSSTVSSAGGAAGGAAGAAAAIGAALTLMPVSLGATRVL